MAHATIVDTHGNAIGQLTLVPMGKADFGMGLEALVQLPAAEAAELGEAELQVLEGARYEYELPEGWQLLPTSWGASTDVVLQSKLPSRQHCGVLNPGLATGTLNLTVQGAAGQPLGTARIEVRSRKLDYRTDYQLMLNDITEHCVGLLQDWQGATDFKAMPDANGDKATLGQQFAFVRALLNTPSFEHALQRIASHPHETWTQEETQLPVVRGFKPSGKLMRQLASGSRRIAVPSGHSLYAVLPTLPERINVRQNSRTTDTPENRFVKFALRSFRQFLAEMRDKPALQTNKHERLRSELDALTDKLDQALGCDALRHAGEPTFLPLGSPTLQRREGYRQVLQAWTSFAMAAKLVWEGGDKVYGMGQRDVATLYEYWVFFELLRTVKDVFKLDMPDIKNLIVPTGDGFGLKLRAGQHLALSGTSKQPGRKLEVRFSYNRTFSSNKTASQTGSWTKHMRPDYTLSLWPVGFTEAQAEAQELMVHVHFDAKYRLAQAAYLLTSPTDAKDASDDEDTTEEDEIKQAEASGTYKRADLLKMHAYRDAIRRSHGAYVVYPGDKQDGEPFQGFHEVLPGLGAFALRPGNGTEALQKFLRNVVAHVCDRTTARERQTYETYKSYQHKGLPLDEERRELYNTMPEQWEQGQRHTPPADTHVLVGWCKDEQHLNWILEKGLYNFRMGATEGGLRLTTEVVSAKYLLLHGTDGLALPRLLRVRNAAQGPSLMNKQQLIDTSYPTEPSREAYLVFEVERSHAFDGMPRDLAAIPNLPGNIKQGYPFATTLDVLLDATNWPKPPPTAQPYLDISQQGK
jgi:predicted component of viral defense system (DUF524 family)